MPRGKKATDGGGGDGQPVQKARSRKKKDSNSLCGTPTGDQHKLDQGMMCQTQMGIEQNGPIGIPHYHFQGMPQHGHTNAPQFLGPPDDAPMPQAANGIQMQQHFGPGPPEFFYNQPQGSFPPPPNIYSIPQASMQPSHSQLPGPGQFSDDSQPQFMFRPQQSPSVPQPPPHPQSLPHQQIIPRPPSNISTFSAFPQPPYFEYRLQEMNRRFYYFKQNFSQLSSNEIAKFWDAFTNEFFDESAKMTLNLSDSSENGVIGPEHFKIGRILIPRFYKTLFASGVSELRYSMRKPVQEYFQQPPFTGLFALTCDDVLVVLKHERPFQSEVHAQCQLFIEFAPYDPFMGYRILNWVMTFVNSTMFIQCLNDGSYVDNNAAHQILRESMARSGLPRPVIEYLKMCMILEPMMKIMERSTMESIAPREALNRICFLQHRMEQHRLGMATQSQPMAGINPQMQMPIINQTQVFLSNEQAGEETGGKKPRKRQRKTAATANTSAQALNPSPKKKTANTPPMMNPNFPSCNLPPAGFNNMAYHQDILTVGSPSLMGNEFGDQDERPITRIENLAYPRSNQGLMRSPSHSHPIPMSMIMHSQQQQQPSRCNTMMQNQQVVMGNHIIGGHSQMLMNVNDFDINSSIPSNAPFQ